MDSSYIPWFAWIAIVGIIVGGIIAIAGGFKGRGKKLHEVTRALEENSVINQELLAKLEGIDQRLGAVEKTLNDIP